MYIKIPARWYDHPFLTNEFTIKSQMQIDKFIQSGITEVLTDPERTIHFEEIESTSHGFEEVQKKPPRMRKSEIKKMSVKASRKSTPGTQKHEMLVSVEEELRRPPKLWEPDKLVPVELREAIHDRALPSEVKSQIVYESSRVMVKRLFEDPKAANIHEAKKGVAEIVDMILSEDETARDLLKITSYDYYTYTHSMNVGVFSVLLSKSLFKRSIAHDMHELGAAFFLHDIGKIRIDKAIINKTGKLSEENMMDMRNHPAFGYNILSETNSLSEECRIIVMQHHEREDGTGYPHGLKGDEIHTYGRICSIADVYDALTADRTYKRRLNTFTALNLMKEQMLNHFHGKMFKEFVMLFR